MKNEKEVEAVERCCCNVTLVYSNCQTDLKVMVVASYKSSKLMPRRAGDQEVTMMRRRSTWPGH